MIDSRELRLGNIVEYEGNYREVVGIFPGRISLKIKGKLLAEGANEEDINPVALNKEWRKPLVDVELIDIGLEAEGDEWEGNYFEYWVFPNGKKINDCDLDSIHYLHRLQNYCFEILNEEMKIIIK